jgi:hypothetical protein
MRSGRIDFYSARSVDTLLLHAEAVESVIGLPVVGPAGGMARLLAAF